METKSFFLLLRSVFCVVEGGLKKLQIIIFCEIMSSVWWTSITLNSVGGIEGAKIPK